MLASETDSTLTTVEKELDSVLLQLSAICLEANYTDVPVERLKGILRKSDNLAEGLASLYTLVQKAHRSKPSLFNPDKPLTV